MLKLFQLFQWVLHCMDILKAGGVGAGGGWINNGSTPIHCWVNNNARSVVDHAAKLRMTVV